MRPTSSHSGLVEESDIAAIDAAELEPDLHNRPVGAGDADVPAKAGDSAPLAREPPWLDASTDGNVGVMVPPPESRGRPD